MMLGQCMLPDIDPTTVNRMPMLGLMECMLSLTAESGYMQTDMS